VALFNAKGKQLWLRQFGTGDRSDYANGVSINAATQAVAVGGHTGGALNGQQNAGGRAERKGWADQALHFKGAVASACFHRFCSVLLGRFFSWFG